MDMREKTRVVEKDLSDPEPDSVHGKKPDPKVRDLVDHGQAFTDVALFGRVPKCAAKPRGGPNFPPRL